MGLRLLRDGKIKKPQIFDRFVQSFYRNNFFTFVQTIGIRKMTIRVESNTETRPTAPCFRLSFIGSSATWQSPINTYACCLNLLTTLTQSVFLFVSKTMTFAIPPMHEHNIITARSPGRTHKYGTELRDNPGQEGSNPHSMTLRTFLFFLLLIRYK